MDKILHFTVSFLFGLVDPTFSFALGILKEVWDALRGELFDLVDLVADVAGIVASQTFF